jgi:iron complex outermembrane receptor protein
MSQPNSRRPSSRLILPLAVSAALIGTGPAAAQTLEEVIVTATKREQGIMDVPLAITALSGDFIEDTNLNDVKDLIAYTPGVSGNSQDSYIDAVSIRGVRTQDFGVGGDPSSAFFKNDLYEGRNGAAVTSLFDVERAEVLRGPQGFLFGRNSIGGAFSVHTKKAEIGSNEAFVDFDFGQRGHAVFEGAVNIPVNDNFAMRLAGYSSKEDGFSRNVFSGRDEIDHEKWAIRWSTTYEADNFTVRTVVDHEDRKQSGSMYRAIDTGDIWDTFDEYIIDDASLGGTNQQLDSDISSGDADVGELTTIGVFVDYDLGFATLTSNTGYKDHDYYYSEDYDGTPLNINNFQFQQSGTYFQQEFRLSGNDDGPLGWYAGVSYYDEDLDAAFNAVGSEDLMCQYYYNSYYDEVYYFNPAYETCNDFYYVTYYLGFEPSASGNLEESGMIKGRYSGWAAYVNLDRDLTDTVNVALGLRYTKDDKDFGLLVPEPESGLGPYFTYGFATAEYIEDSKSWSDTTARVALTWTPTDDNMFFANYTQGFKSGGFGSFWIQDDAGIPPLYETGITQSDGYKPGTFRPEQMDSYEVGFKTTYLDGAGNLDITAFFYDYTDAQVITYVDVDADGDGSIDAFSARVLNVGQTDGSGVEASTTLAMNEFTTLYLSVGYLDTEATGLSEICGIDGANEGDGLGCEGSRVFWAPELTVAGKLDVEFPMQNGSINSSFEISYESERGGSWEGNPEGMISSYSVANLRVGYESDNNWYVQAYAENVFNEFTWDGYNANGGILPSHFFGPMRPRTFGIRTGISWD